MIQRPLFRIPHWYPIFSDSDFKLNNAFSFSGSEILVLNLNSSNLVSIYSSFRIVLVCAPRLKLIEKKKTEMKVENFS
ncbi:MAG TPA: hypothetical protein DF603_07740 [Chryseobacterium sp.]|nr:hypothetical protein [Chryseobacterium sp.]